MPPQGELSPQATEGVRRPFQGRQRRPLRGSWLPEGQTEGGTAAIPSAGEAPSALSPQKGVALSGVFASRQAGI